MKKISSIDSLDEVQFTLDNDSQFDITKPIPKKSDHYVNNAKLREELIKYHEEYQQWLADEKEGVPPIKSNIIGNAILQIARNATNMPRYVRYTNAWKEEFIGRAIEQCVSKCHVFNPYRRNKKGDLTSAFSFFTQICVNSFKEQIEIEKTEMYKSYKLMEEIDSFYGELSDNVNPEDMDLSNNTGFIDNKERHISEFENRLSDKQQKRKAKSLEIRNKNLVQLF